MKSGIKPFGLVFKAQSQPGVQSRYGNSLDRFLGGANIISPKERLDTTLMDKSNLREKFRSGCVPQTLPSYFQKVRMKAK